jgi:hypothetical protein
VFPVPDRTNIITSVRRWACCDVWFNNYTRPDCEFCGEPMTPAHEYPDRSTQAWANRIRQQEATP